MRRAHRWRRVPRRVYAGYEQRHPAFGCQRHLAFGYQNLCAVNEIEKETVSIQRWQGRPQTGRQYQNPSRENSRQKTGYDDNLSPPPHPRPARSSSQRYNKDGSEPGSVSESFHRRQHPY